VTNLTDAVNNLNFLFRGGFDLYCASIGDANDDGDVNISDAVAILGYLFLGDAAPPELTAEDLASCSGNQAPTVEALPLYRAFTGTQVEFQLLATDPEQDPLRFEATSLPAGATLDPDGRLRWTPTAEQLGAATLRFAVFDGASPPNRVEGERSFYVLPLDPCTRPRCDPLLGCEPTLVSLPEECCGDPVPIVPDLDMGCPESRVLHIGRNPKAAATIGRVQNCDRVRFEPVGQGGHWLTFNLQTRCLEPELISVRARLETATTVYFDERFQRTFEVKPDGVLELRGIRLIAEGRLTEGEEIQLWVTLTDAAGDQVERKLRVVMTFGRLDELP
jgi:hypothetical protein